MWKLKGEGTRGPLDLPRVGQHRLLPRGLAHTGAAAAQHRRQEAHDAVTFTVTDAGDPVAGAKVAYAGKTFTTNAKGQATTTLAASTTKATAGKTGYSGAAVTVAA